MYKFKKDNFRNVRGKWSRVLEATCYTCKNHLFYYQKDGPGPLKRSYLDRFIDIKPKKTKEFRCENCNELLGIFQPYKKENNRPAISWLASVLVYKIVPLSKMGEIPNKVH